MIEVKPCFLLLHNYSYIIAMDDGWLTLVRPTDCASLSLRGLKNRDLCTPTTREKAYVSNNRMNLVAP